MIDPGHPFSVPLQQIIDGLENRLRDGVEQPEEQTFVFKSDVSAYELRRTAFAITRVTGIDTDKNFTVFTTGIDYILSNNRIIWRREGNASHPRDGSKFTVEFTYRERAAGLNDFNPGSVTGTLIRSVAREIKLLYEQIDQAYRRAFIDVAEGAALDNVVALLGVVRNPAIPATGEVTFTLKQPSDREIFVPKGTRIADENGRGFQTTRFSDTREDAVIPIGDTRVVVPIAAVEPGPDGNVNEETIVIMPTPPAGVDGVSNQKPTSGGKNPEPDDQLRERAKHALEQAGNASLNALRFAVLDVDGVDDVQVLDHSTDDTIPLGEVRVRYSGPDDIREKVQAAVDVTRAAGILVRLDTVNEVLIAGNIYVIPERSVADTARVELVSAIVEAINELSIGQPLSIRRLNAMVFDISGLADTAETQLTFQHKEDQENPGTFLDGDVVDDPFFVGNTELLRASKSDPPSVRMVKSLQTNSLAPSTGSVRFELQFLDADNTLIRFRNFVVDINVVLTALLESNDQPENIGRFKLPATFADSDTSTVDVSVSGFEASRHKKDVEVVMEAAAYAGIDNTGARSSIRLKP